MKRTTYAREITKDYLKKLGVEYVSKDGLTVIVNGKEVKFRRTYSGSRPYENVQLYDPEIRQSVPAELRKTSTGQFMVGVHIVNYVWNKDPVKPAGLVIDHIDNDSLNNDISNLQLSTCRDNVNKEKNRPPRVVQMPKYITEAKILKKLNEFEAAYEQAKRDHDAEAAHKYRCSLSIWRAKHRQYLENPELYKKPVKKVVEHECHARAEQRRNLQADIDSARKIYKELLKAYGKDDPIVYQYWGEWRLAIARLHGFNEENKRTKEA